MLSVTLQPGAGLCVALSSSYSSFPRSTLARDTAWDNSDRGILRASGRFLRKTLA
jgi:hypothetical protein